MADDKRTLRLVISTARGGLPALLLATTAVLPAACSGEVDSGGPGSSTSSSSSTATTMTSGSGGSGGVSFTTGSTGGQGGGPDEICVNYQSQHDFIVPLPPAGVPAQADQICNVNMSPVQSGQAARVSLVKYSQSVILATGLVKIEPDLLKDVIGLPTVEVVEAWEQGLKQVKITQMSLSAQGFTFHAEFPVFYPDPAKYTQLVVKTTFELKCSAQPGDKRIVESLTYVHLCDTDDGVVWVSSGDACTVCEAVLEMAPSPRVADAGDDELALPRSLRLRILPLVTVGRTVVLLAENDGGRGQVYEWQPTGGELIQLADDVVAWTPPNDGGPHHLRVAVHSDQAAAVASFSSGSLAA